MPPIRNTPRSHRVHVLLFILGHILKLFISLFIREIIRAEEAEKEPQPLARRRVLATDTEEDEEEEEPSSH